MFGPREEGRVMAEFTLVDLHYQLRDLHDFIEERFVEQRELLGRKRGDTKLSRTVSWDPKTKAEEPLPEYVSVVKSPREEVVVVEPEQPRISQNSVESMGSLTRFSAQTDASKRSYGSSKMSSSVWDEVGSRFREKAKKQAIRLRQSRVVSERSQGQRRSTLSHAQRLAARVATSPWFQNGVVLLILINIILLGVEVDISREVGIKDIPQWLSWANACFVMVFVLELGLRFAAVGFQGFWCGEDSSWNVFDFAVIAVSVADVVLDYVSQLTPSSVNTQQLRLVRSVRLARALRGVRIVWLFEYVGALRTLALSIISTSGSLFWTLVILVILVYSFGVVVTQLVVDHCRILAVEALSEPNAIPDCPQELSRYWASVPASMLTLFASISGGLDWENTMQALWDVSGWAVCLVLIYVTITVFAVLNVVIGVFCNTAIENASADKELASIKQVYMKSHQVQVLRKIFKEIDIDNANEVSIEDLEEAMTQGELAGFLESMGISTDDIWTLCILLDTDKSGTIDLEEFVTGCMQLHGPAKSMQIAKMSYEQRSNRRDLKQLLQDLHVLKMKLGAGTAREAF